MSVPTVAGTAPASAPASTSEAIEFVQSHEPPLPRGDYPLTMRQSVTVAGATHEFSTGRWFLVRGSRWLQPADVVAVFPTDQQLGEYSHTLPHVVLSRSTLPWERSAVPGSGSPWLALLLFADNEKPEPAVVPLSALRAATASTPRWPGLPAEEGEDETAKLTVIDVPRALLAAQLPDVADLATLTHVRRSTGTATGPSSGTETAVVVGGRLPVPGGRSTVHLVSLENRYAAGNPSAVGSFDFGSAADSDLVRLVSMTSWALSCVEPAQTFSHLVANLDPFGSAAPAGSPAALRLPAAADPIAERYLAQGNVPLPHRLRDGTGTVSWYRGPLAPAAPAAAPGPPVPARAADALLRYDPANGLLDVSYAAAWELGRLLTLASRQVSTSLFLYKRQLVQQIKATTQSDAAHLPVTPPAPPAATSEVATTVRTWFAGFARSPASPSPIWCPTSDSFRPSRCGSSRSTRRGCVACSTAHTRSAASPPGMRAMMRRYRYSR